MAGEIADLAETEAQEITSRIRQWVQDFPTDDVARAFRGRVWLAMGYQSWTDWCDHELGGFKLLAPQRREVVEELAGRGISNKAIADALGTSNDTVRRDKESAGVANETPVIGQDGKTYARPKPAPVAPKPEIIDAEIVEATPAMQRAILELSKRMDVIYDEWLAICESDEYDDGARAFAHERLGMFAQLGNEYTQYTTDESEKRK